MCEVELWDWADVLSVAEVTRYARLIQPKANVSGVLRALEYDDSGLRPALASAIRRTAAMCDPPRCRTCDNFVERHESIQGIGSCHAYRDLGVVLPVPIDGGGHCHKHDPRPQITPLEYLRRLWTSDCHGCVNVSALDPQERRLVAALLRQGLMYRVDDIAMTSEAGREALGVEP